MSELSGEKIEGLLWEAGCEVSHDGGKEEISPIKVTVGQTEVIISEAWFEDGEWFADTDTLVLEKILDGEKVDEDLEVFETEEELVEHILRLGGGL
jgi:hypothetical protein